MKKGLLIGTSDFKRYIDDNGYFVDKSLFIKEVLDNKSTVQLITRPRRFGKTLNMTMLRYFFENTKEDNRYLFKDLEISKHSDIMEHQGKYPVIYLTFKDIKYSSWDICKDRLFAEISRIYEEFSYVLGDDSVTEKDKKIFNKIIEEEDKIGLYLDSLKELCKYISKYHNKKVILLIDEYDTPIHSAYLNGYYDEIIEFKKFNSNREETIEEAAQNAINQIKNKNYKQELLDEGIKNIIEIGIAFKGKDVRVVEG